MQFFYFLCHHNHTSPDKKQEERQNTHPLYFKDKKTDIRKSVYRPSGGV